MNIAIYGLMMIIFIVVPFIAGGERLEFSSVLNDLYKFLSMMSMGAKVLLSSFIYLTLTIFVSIQGQSAYSSLTREGKHIWLVKSLPISSKDQIRGRIKASFFISLFNVLPIIVVSIFLFREPL